MNVYLIPWFLIIDDQFGPFYVKGTLHATLPWDKILCLGSSFAICNYILCLNRMVEYLLMVWRGVKILTTLGGWQTLSFLHLLSNSSFNSSWVEERGRRRKKWLKKWRWKRQNRRWCLCIPFCQKATLREGDWWGGRARRRRSLSGEVSPSAFFLKLWKSGFPSTGYYALLSKGQGVAP